MMASRCMPEDHGNILDDQKEYLQEKLEPTLIIAQLRENGIISTTERDEIARQPKKALRVETLVSYLKTKDCFEHFVEVLRSCDLSDVADQLSHVGKLKKDMQTLLGDIEQMLLNESDKAKRAKLLAVQSRTNEINKGISEMLASRSKTLEKLSKAEEEISELKRRVKVLEAMNHKMDAHADQLEKLKKSLETKIDAEEIQSIKQDIVDQVLKKMQTLTTRDASGGAKKLPTTLKTSEPRPPVDKGPVWKPQ